MNQLGTESRFISLHSSHCTIIPYWNMGFIPGMIGNHLKILNRRVTNVIFARYSGCSMEGTVMSVKIRDRKIS